jgi:hypothetical protein
MSITKQLIIMERISLGEEAMIIRAGLELILQKVTESKKLYTEKEYDRLCKGILGLMAKYFKISLIENRKNDFKTGLN